jgi:hypothetical protein
VVSDLLVHARRELERARSTHDPVEAHLTQRQAAEKAWGYVVEETNRIAGITATGPGAHHLRREALAALDRRAGTSLLRDYIEFEYRLHGEGFYDGRGRLHDIAQYVELASAYPEKLRRALEQVRR